MSVETTRKDKLTRGEVDFLAEEIGSFLDKSDLERATRLRIRLMIEDQILSVCERLGEDTEYKFETGKVFGSRYIRFSYAGESYEPGADSDDPSENWSKHLMADMGLAPTWQYKNGVNILELKLGKKNISSIMAILIALGLALLIGFATTAVVPEDVKSILIELVLDTLEKVFFSLLSVFAGIMILLSVTCGIFNMGDMSTFSKVGKTMFGRFLGLTIVFVSASSILCFFVFRPEIGIGSLNGVSREGISEIVQMIYNMIPSDPITMFMTGNAMQLIFLGLILGIALLILGEKVRHVEELAEQGSLLVTSVLSIICKLLPVYIFMIAFEMIWSGTFVRMLNIWKPFLMYCVLAMVIIVLYIFSLTVRYKVGFLTVTKKILPSVLIGLTTASSVSAYGQVMNDSEKKLGVEEKFVSVIHPIAEVLYKPSFAVELVILVYCMAKQYDVKTSIAWMIMGIIMCTVIAMATPPLPGAAAISFGILFSQMGVPEEAMAIAITCDLFCDFIGTAIDTGAAMVEFVLQADRIKVLDREVLRSKV